MNKYKMPVIFVGHGSPMNAIEDNEFTKNFKKVAKGIPKPKAIICISAHWVTEGTKVTAMEKPKTIHDFYGFPEELYNIEYPAVGSLKLAEEIKSLLSDTTVESDYSWGLDHGTWSVLRHMYPDADVPVVQISLDYNKSSKEHFDLAKNLSKLREEGILIIGSGDIVHNLREIDFKNIETHDYGYDWAKRIQKDINKDILEDHFENIYNYDDKNSDYNLAIPTPEHFWPLLYVLGLKEESDNIEIWNDILVGGSLSMTSITASNSK
ncbi:MAG: 4,5-DOPA dioxygenase extradiol [Candidatus Nomurabacteria bacterium]